MRIQSLLVVILVCLPSLALANAGQKKNTKKEQELQKLDEYCSSLREEERRQKEECKTEEEKHVDALIGQIEEERAEKEKPTKNHFWEHIHLDGLWVPTQIGNHTFGFVGTHITIMDIGRVEIFGPPGVIVLGIQREKGGWEIRPAFTWGASVRLFDFRFPGTEKNAVLFANLTKCWVFGGVRNGFDLGGLSVSWRNHK